MPLRELVRIDEERCDGCGLCVPACAEGAIQVIDGKARLVSEVYCDGLGACLGHCPQEAISVIKVEARAFDHEAVAAHLARQAPAAPVATDARAAAAAPSRPPAPDVHATPHGGGCPGARMLQFAAPAASREPVDDGEPAPSELRQWPVQLHLVSPLAPYFRGAEVLLTADCVPFAMADFHRRFLRGRALAVACPKLDQNQDVYFDKVRAMIEQAGIRSLHVVIMQVPCCGGLLRLAQDAVAGASRQVPICCTIVGVQGEVLDERLV